MDEDLINTDIKRNIFSLLQRTPYMVEKDIKSAIDGTEQNIATQLRQLLEDGILERRKSGGIYRYYIPGTAKVPQKVPQEVPQEEIEEVEESDMDTMSIRGFLQYLLDEEPVTLEMVSEATKTNIELTKTILDYLVEEKFLIKEEEQYMFNTEFMIEDGK